MKKLSIIALALVLPALAGASGYEVITIHPRDLALTSSAVAAQDGAAAAFFNPSALSKVDGMAASAGISMLSVQTDWKAPAGQTDVTGSQTSEFEPVTPIAGYFAWGTKLNGHGFGLGLGVGNPAGGNVLYDAQWEGRGRIIQVQRRLFGFYGSTGYELVPERVRVGASVIYYRAMEFLKQGIPPFPDAHAELDTAGGGWTFGLSAEAKPFDGIPVTIAVDYKRQADISTKGDGHFQVPAALQTQLQDQGVTHDFTFPDLLAVGVAWRVSKPVQLTLQYSYSNWSVYQDDTFKGDKGLTIVVPRKYQDGNIIRAGVEWFTTPTWTLRAGFMRDWSGYDSAAYSPTLPDSNIWAGAVGAGWAVHKDFEINGAFFYGIRDRVHSTNWKTTDTPEGVTFPGVYDTTVWIGSVGVTWHMPNK